MGTFPITLCPEAAVPPVIDGVLSPGEWDDGALLSPFVRVGDPTAPAEYTEVRVLHDAAAVYVGAILHDSQPEFIKADITQKDGDVFEDDSLELFFITRLQKDDQGQWIPPFSYYHLAVNSRSVQLDDIDGDRTADIVWEGRAHVLETGWSVECRIDLTSGARPPLGSSWGFEIGRNLPRLGEMSSWSGCQASFREPENFGELRFGSSGLQFDLVDVGQRRLGANEATLITRNTGAESQQVKVNVRVMGRTRAGHAFTATKVTVPAEQRLVARAPYKVVEDGPGTVLISVTDHTGASIYRTAEYPFLNPSCTEALFATERLLAEALLAWVKLPAGAQRQALRQEIDDLKGRHQQLAARVAQRASLATLDQELLAGDVQELRDDAQKLVQRVSVASAQGTAASFSVSAVSALEHVFADELAVLAVPSYSLAAARNEVESFQIVVCPLDNDVEGITLKAQDLQAAGGATMPAGCIRLRSVKGVLATSHLEPDEGPRRWPDALLDGPGTRKPISVKRSQSAAFWVTISVPETAAPGEYAGQIEVTDGNGAAAAVDVRLTVYDVLLPPPEQMRFVLDAWQNPTAIAAHYQVPLWSQQHWQLLELYLQDLAQHGQKLATVTRDMVQWQQDAGGAWSFDYLVLDRYVELCRQVGIEGGIEYVSMFTPGGQNVVRWTDAAGEVVQQTVAPGDPQFQQAWSAFLKDFAAHLREKAWLQHTYICPATEPRGDEAQRQFLTAALLAKTVDPAFLLTTVLDSLEAARALEPQIDRLVLGLREDVYDARFAETERALGKTVAWYLCRYPQRPNTFITSPAIEPRILGWLSFREGMTGLLRGSHTDWPDDPWGAPQGDSPSPAGDRFLVYPSPVGPLASARWERLLDGIEDYELLAMLQDAAALARVEGRVAQAQEAEAVAGQVVETVAGGAPALTSYTTDPAVLLEAHERVLQALVTAQGQ